MKSEPSREEFPESAGAADWMASEGPDHEVILTSRIRLARNLRKFPFKARLSEDACRSLEQYLRPHLEELHMAEDQRYVSLDEVPPVERELLLERHLISVELARGKGPRGVSYSTQRHLSLMVNEEDHLRVQVLAPGLALEDSLARIVEIDEALALHVEFATHPRFGYLTSCPTNVGTGLRFSVMMHLPALVFSKEIEKEFNAAAKAKLAVRGFYGEGTSSFLGDFFQVSNQVTLGRDADVLLSDLLRVIPTIVDHEREVRRIIQKDHALELEDRVFRAYGILCNSRRISSQEALELLSRLRLGVCLGMVEGVDLKTLNELLVLTQPAHVQLLERRRDLTEEERDAARASYLRRRLAGDSDP